MTLSPEESQEREQHPFALRREERLRGRTTISQLFSEGQSGFTYPLRYVWMEGSTFEALAVSEDEEAEVEVVACSPKASVMFNVPKRFHRRANKRNLLRRRVKEAYRLQKSQLIVEGRRPLRIALIYTTKEVLTYSQISRAVGKILNQINDERAKGL